MRQVHLWIGLTVLACAGQTTSGSKDLDPSRSPQVTSAAINDLPGITAPVEILTDRWGVPHIYAQNLDDLFFAQGFQAARDRLWQIDLWRKRGLGEMAKDFGPAYVDGDQMARAFLFRGDMYREWLAYGSDSKRVAERFVAGVNAFVTLTEQKPELLPVEFRLLGYKPAKWSPADVVRIRHHGLTLNFTSEVDRANVYCQGARNGERIDTLRRQLTPPVHPRVPQGLDVCTIPVAELKRAYALATAPPRFTKEMLKRTDEIHQPAAASSAPEDGSAFGSNNWTIAPSKTTTGRPILANDPHRSHGAPSLRYIVHLAVPGFAVIGAGEPFLPGISIGHNGTIAFGLTRFYIDQEDLYVYELNPSNPNEYKYNGRWEPLQVRTEIIEVKGEAPRTATLRFTRHGPVLFIDSPKNRAYALRAAWLESGMAPYFGSMDYMRARNWDQFKAAMNRWGAPGENQVYADTAGNIGWIPGGLTPSRPNWDGLFPVPGDGRYEWGGFRDMDELPSEFNPPRGYIVTANENNIPTAHPASKIGVGYEWNDPARRQRLDTLFDSTGRFSVEDSQRFQTDTVSTHATRMVKLLQSIRPESADGDQTLAQGLQLLRGWDGNENPESAAAALFEVWFNKYLRGAVLKQSLGDAGAKLAEPGDGAQVIAVLERPDSWMTPEQRDAVIVSSLKRAIDEVSVKLGKDMRAWRWGGLHVAVFEHPLQTVVDPAVRDKLTVGRWPLGGSGFTPMATHYGNDYVLTAGASFRMVLDVGNWDDSRVVNAPGQSGNPDSAHYRDLAPLWASGQYFPLLYTRAAVEGATESRLVLSPPKN